MAEMVKAYIDWKLCEMGDTPSVGDLDQLYPIPPLPRVSLLPHITHLLLPLNVRPSRLSLKRWNKANVQQLLMQKYDPDVIVPSIKPMCLSTNGLKHKLEPIENEGWYVLVQLHLSFIN